MGPSLNFHFSISLFQWHEGQKHILLPRGLAQSKAQKIEDEDHCLVVKDKVLNPQEDNKEKPQVVKNHKIRVRLLAL